MMTDLTLISCSYETPKIVETMLKSFVFHHPNIKTKLLIMENSKNDETELLLESYCFNFVKTTGGSHARTLERAIKECKTKYALVVDTDIIFNQSIVPLFEDFKSKGVSLAGVECGDRGGFQFYTRTHPWFMFVDVENVNNNNISFVNMEKLERTGSVGFFFLTADNFPKNDGLKYDVGATFREDIVEAGLIVENRPDYELYFTHYEGSSWQRGCGDPNIKLNGDQTWERYQVEIEKYKHVDIFDKFDSYGF